MLKVEVPKSRSKFELLNVQSQVFEFQKEVRGKILRRGPNLRFQMFKDEVPNVQSGGSKCLKSTFQNSKVEVQNLQI